MPRVPRGACLQVACLQQEQQLQELLVKGVLGRPPLSSTLSSQGLRDYVTCGPAGADDGVVRAERQGDGGIVHQQTPIHPPAHPPEILAMQCHGHRPFGVSGPAGSAGPSGRPPSAPRSAALERSETSLRRFRRFFCSALLAELL